MKNKIWCFQNLLVASDVINLKIIFVKMPIWKQKKAEITNEVIMGIFNAIVRNYICQIQLNWNINQRFPTQF